MRRVCRRGGVVNSADGFGPQLSRRPPTVTLGTSETQAALLRLPSGTELVTGMSQRRTSLGEE
ncbi:hypothetical protein CCH79_00017013 [Gambusia affinis]|uniref:Uncharacterized protein n=1 Tax=Gambusia affinis TaxID=33528 RepID=A0A315UNY2_GAMAF|nr:hypothetical protein CCH79_00017013 [Gambusia affinis]